MRVLLAQLAPRRGDLGANLERLARIVAGSRVDLAVFPELYLSGYLVGDRIHRLALASGDPMWTQLGALARQTGTAVAVGAPVALASRRGETLNAVLLATPDGEVRVQEKRYLPTYGPFDEGATFTPGDASRPLEVGHASIGFEVCYDAFFPEVSRALALGGADLLVVLSAAPVTSGPLFEKVLPARAVENACPLVYVNRVGVEDGIVFGGSSAAWDARGERIPPSPSALPDAIGPEESVGVVEVDIADAARWRPSRPVLRDVSARPSRHEPPRATAPSTTRHRRPGPRGTQRRPRRPGRR
ncbi:MAG: carbon-nitrogen hydrolase family protein [Thermoplasmata archaeon]